MDVLSTYFPPLLFLLACFCLSLGGWLTKQRRRVHLAPLPKEIWLHRRRVLHALVFPPYRALPRKPIWSARCQACGTSSEDLDELFCGWCGHPHTPLLVNRREREIRKRPSLLTSS